MKFLQNFQQKMEVNMVDTRRSIEDTNKIINGRLDDIDKEVREVNTKIVEIESKNQDVSKRMEQRLNKLEEEMIRSTKLKRRSLELREKEENLKIQPEGRSGTSTRQVTENERTKEKNVKKYSEKVEEVTKVILNEPVGTFRSSWARSMEEELRQAAGVADMTRKESNGDGGNEVFEVVDVTEDIPDIWEHRFSNEPAMRKHKMSTAPTIRKPPVQECFGIATSSEEDSENETVQWSEVERKRKSEEKRKKAYMKKKNLKHDCAARAANMLSVGPVSMDSVMYFRQKGQDFEEAKVSAFKEFCEYNLNYSLEELNNLKVAETRISTKGDDIINVAMANEDDAKELFVRRAESKNDNITVRCYIPPNFHERFMALNKICTEKRRDDSNLKTQLRFGRKDVEVYTKIKR